MALKSLVRRVKCGSLTFTPYGKVVVVVDDDSVEVEVVGGNSSVLGFLNSLASFDSDARRLFGGNFSR